MANEIQGSYITGRTIYALVRSSNGDVWNTTSTALETYQSSRYSGYVIGATEQGTASAYYQASMPASIPTGLYNITLKNQQSNDPAETDPTVDAGSIDWGNGYVAQINQLAVSGLVQPIQLQRGVQILNYPIYLRSSADHITGFTSGTISGQISKDNTGSFGPLQSGAFTEVGYGVYNLQALTSGDLSANTLTLLFTGVSVQGGNSDPLVQSFITQHSSGY